jgi:hypothetical protein
VPPPVRSASVAFAAASSATGRRTARCRAPRRTPMMTGPARGRRATLHVPLRRVHARLLHVQRRLRCNALRTVRRRNALLQGRSKMEDRRGAPRRALMMR